MDIEKIGRVTWGLLQIFGPLVLMLFVVSSRPVTRAYGRYLKWVDAKFEPLRREQDARIEKHRRKIVATQIEHQFNILDVWYDAWFDNGTTEPCPLSHLRNASSFKCLHYRIDTTTDTIVFSYHGYEGTERRWPLNTIDLEK